MSPNAQLGLFDPAPPAEPVIRIPLTAPQPVRDLIAQIITALEERGGYWITSGRGKRWLQFRAASLVGLGIDEVNELIT